MKKIFALVVIALICWGVVTAQTPDSTMVCDLPTVLDSIGDMPVCPTFGPTVATQTSDGSVLVTAPLLNYKPGLVYHTGIVGSDSMYFTVRMNTSSMDVPGSDAGSIEAVYDSVLQRITCTIITSHVTFNARYDFTPHLNVTGYCNTASGNYMTVDGPDGYVITQVHCPSYGDTTVAVRNADGSVTVTHRLVGYSPAVLNPNPSASPRFLGFDTTNMQRMYSTDFVVSDSGLMTYTFPASNFSNYPSHNMYFKPKIYLAQGYGCSLPTTAQPSNSVCIPYDTLPSFSGVSNTWGVVKFDLFTNEGVILKAKIENYSAHANQIAKMGFLISRSPISGYHEQKAVLGTLGGSTGDTLSYKVGMDSCGGVIYYRPYLIMKGCDAQVVLGAPKSFTMWAPDFTVSATPDTILAGEAVELKAVATMDVVRWNQSTSNGVPCEMIGYFANSCNLTYTEDCSTTKNMELWMYLLVGLRNCPNFWNSFSGVITDAIGMDPGVADFQYRWMRGNSVFFSTPSVSDPGVTTVSPWATTVYTGVADFTYNGVHCIQKRSVTVTVQ